MDSIVVLNIGNVWHANPRASVQDAARRWGAQVVEIDTNLVGELDVCYNKVFGIDRLRREIPELDGVLYLDADILIHQSCPNPFEIFLDRTKLYAVTDCDHSRWDINSRPYQCILKEVTCPWIQMLETKHKWGLTREEIENRVQWFFNAGVFLFYPNNSIIEIERFITNVPEKEIYGGRYEQALWNYIWRINKKVQLIDHTWNTLTSPDLFPDTMNKYVYHFTGIDSRFDGTREKLKTCKWTD